MVRLIMRGAAILAALILMQALVFLAFIGYDALGLLSADAIQWGGGL